MVLVGVAELLVGLLGTTGCWADKIIGLKIKVHFNYGKHNYGWHN